MDISKVMRGYQDQNEVLIDFQDFENYEKNPSIATGNFVRLININQIDGLYDIKIDCRIFSLEKYAYFPFYIEFILSNNRVEIFKIDGKSQSYEVNLRNVEIKKGSVCFQLVSEMFFNDFNEKGCGDERNICCYLFSVNLLRVDTHNYERRIHYKNQKNIYFDKFASPVVPNKNPVYIVGCYRSGTSILSWALGQHPNFLTLEETGWLPTILYSLVTAFKRAYNADRSVVKELGLNISEYLESFGQSINDYERKIFIRHGLNINHQKISKDEIRNDGFDLFKTPMSPNQRTVDSTPENSTVIELIAQAFKGSKFIFILRNPVDVINSLLNFGKGYSYEDAVKFWCVINQIIYTYYFKHQDRVIMIDYNELINHPNFTLARIYEFLDESNFINASDTFKVRINASNIIDKFDLGAYPDDIALLNIIHKSMLGKVKPENINWKHLSIGNTDELHNEIINKFFSILSS